MKNFEEKLKAFLDRHEGVVNLDDVYKNVPNRPNLTDYLLDNGNYLCELKAIRSTGLKYLDAMIEGIQGRPEFPLFVGPVPFERLIRDFPEKNELRREIVNKIGRRIENDISKANTQIKSTSALSPVKHSKGVLILINELDDALSPEFITKKVTMCLNKKKQDGSGAYSAIAEIVIINPRFVGKIAGNNSQPLIFLSNDFAYPEGDPLLENYLSQLFKSFCGLYGLGYVEGIEASLDEFYMCSNNKEDFKALNFTEKIVYLYDKHRVLANISDDNLLTFGKNAFYVLSKKFLKGHNMKVDSDEEVENSVVQFICFYEEARLRLLDLKAFGPHVQEIVRHIYGR